MEDDKKTIKTVLIVIGVLAALAAAAYAAYRFLYCEKKETPKFDDAMPNIPDEDEETPEVDLGDEPAAVETEAVEKAAEEVTEAVKEA